MSEINLNTGKTVSPVSSTTPPEKAQDNTTVGVAAESASLGTTHVEAYKP